MKLEKLLLPALSLGLGAVCSSPALAVDYGDWVLMGTEDLTSFVADADLPVDPMGLWRLVDFRIDRAWIKDEQVSSEPVSHTRTGAWKKIGDELDYSEVLLGSPQTYGEESVVTRELGPEVGGAETRTSSNGACTYQVRKSRRRFENTVTRPYRIDYTYGEQVRHTYTFSAAFEDVNRITFYNPIVKSNNTVEVKSTTTDTLVTLTDFVDDGNTRVVTLNDKDVVTNVTVAGYEVSEIPGTRVANVGKTRAAMNAESKAFASNSQIGSGAEKVYYSGARERLATGVDKVKPTEVRDPLEVITSSLLNDILRQSVSAKDPSNFDEVAQRLAILKARADSSNLRPAQTVDINRAIDAVNKQVSSTKANLAYQEAAAEIAKNTYDKAAQKAAAEARLVADNARIAADNARSAVDKIYAAARAAAEHLARSEKEAADRKAAQALAEKLAVEKAAAEKLVVDRAAADKLAGEKAAASFNGVNDWSDLGVAMKNAKDAAALLNLARAVIEREGGSLKTTEAGLSAAVMQQRLNNNRSLDKFTMILDLFAVRDDLLEGNSEADLRAFCSGAAPSEGSKLQLLSKLGFQVTHPVATVARDGKITYSFALKLGDEVGQTYAVQCKNGGASE